MISLCQSMFTISGDCQPDAKEINHRTMIVEELQVTIRKSYPGIFFVEDFILRVW